MVIGGSQAGLAVGYHLKRRGLPFVIVDENERVGDAWRKRWDSLRLFTPARYNGLPGMPFPGPSSAYPTKDETADYLEAYAREFELPVRTGVKVDRLSKAGDRFEAFCGEEMLSAENVVVATGAFHDPRVPAFARELDESIVQLHSSEYRNPSQMREGGSARRGRRELRRRDRHRARRPSPDVVIGLGHGAGTHPRREYSRSPVHANHVVDGDAADGEDLDGKKAARPLSRSSPRNPSGPRATEGHHRRRYRAGREDHGVRDGYPLLDDGRVLDVSNVIWCTGYTPDYNWIDLALPTRHGLPIQDRGIVESVPGLYFMGLLFLYSLSSALVGGVGRDAEHIVDHIASKRAGRRRLCLTRVRKRETCLSG